MTSRFLVSALFAISGSAFAAEAGSQFQYQTPADKMELTPALGYVTENYKFIGGSESKGTGMRQRLMFEYGISEQFSAGVQLENSSIDYKLTPGTTTRTQSGLKDLRAFFQGRNEMSAASLRYGISVDFGLAKNKTESNGNMNNSSGGIGLAPFVGYEMYMAPCTFGARLSYSMFMGERTHTDETSSPATEDKINGPSVLTTSFFYEHDMAPAKLGAALQIMNTSQTKTKSGTAASVDDKNSSSAYNLKLYAPYEVTPAIVILPEFNYTSYTAVPHTTYDSRGGFSLDVGARFVF